MQVLASHWSQSSGAGLLALRSRAFSIATPSAHLRSDWGCNLGCNLGSWRCNSGSNWSSNRGCNRGCNWGSKWGDNWGGNWGRHSRGCNLDHSRRGSLSHYLRSNFWRSLSHNLRCSFRCSFWHNFRCNFGRFLGSNLNARALFSVYFSPSTTALS